MDTLVLKGLVFRGLHGFYEFERQEGNDFEVDVTFDLSLQKAGENDDLSATIDYQKVYELVEKVMLGSSVKLIEHLAFKIGEQLFKTFVCEQVIITVRKMAPPIESAHLQYSEVSLTWPR